MNRQLGLLQFAPAYFERIWGGTRLQDVLGMDTPRDKVIGEAWMLADHPQHESVVTQGPWAGKTLRELLEHDAPAILGSRAPLTIHGRFPLLLKLLDSAQPLSVQVHPNDEDAKRLGEPDVGKTEMWHVFQAAPGSELICGMDPKVERDAFAQAVGDGSVEQLMTSFKVEEGTSTFVAAGTVHAIGGGILLAEIQQNSDITYRLYDWGRLQDDGTPRQLHVDKGIEVIHFGSPHGGAASPLAYGVEGGTCTVLAACRYFSAELLEIDGRFERATRGESFHIVLAKSGAVSIAVKGEAAIALLPGETVLVPAACAAYTLKGQGQCLDYYVPDLAQDITAPLQQAGHAADAIVRLGGDPASSDLR